MTNFGWEDISGQKRELLIKRLRDELGLRYVDECPLDGRTPYLEVDGLYPGVRIRRITHLGDHEQDILVINADRIYCEVVGKDHSNHDKWLKDHGVV